MGIFDQLYSDPNQAGLLGMAQGLLQAGGPQRVPMGFGSALGQGLQGGIQGAQAAQQFKQQQLMQAMHQQLMGAQIGNYSSEESHRKALEAETKRKADEAQRELDMQGQAHDYAVAQIAKSRTPDDGKPVDVTGAAGNYAAMPDYYEHKAAFYSQNKMGKQALEDSKQAQALRNELNKPPDTKDIALDDKMQQKKSYNPATGKYDIAQSAPFPIHTGTSPTTITNQVRDDFTKAAKNFVDVRDGYQKILESAKNPSAAGDLSMIFAYMKILDPTSVVREGEQATAANARGVPEALRSWYNRVMTGEKLTDPQRADFLERGGMLYNAALENHKTLENAFTGIATRSGINPQDVVIPYRVKSLADKYNF